MHFISLHTHGKQTDALNDRRKTIRKIGSVCMCCTGQVETSWPGLSFPQRMIKTLHAHTFAIREMIRDCIV